MKRVVLLQRLREEGCVLAQHGSAHDIYRNVITGAVEAVPRHSEINEYTARAIIRHLSSPEPES